jgi:membrane protein DedA with SNARE-associated domain
MKLSTSQFAKWSAIATLVLAVVWPVLCYLQGRFDDGSDKLSVFDFLAMGVAILALAAPQVCIVALILSRQQKKGKDDHVA